MEGAPSIISELRALSERAGDQPFLRIDGSEYTYAEAWARISAVARGLLALGIAPGDRVGIMADNRAETIWAWLGANAARAIDVHFNSAARGGLLAYFVADAEPRILIGTSEYLKALASTIEQAPEHAILIGDGEPAFGAGTNQLGFADVVRDGEASSAKLPDPQPAETATIMYSSGTTGPSKGVMLPHGYYLANGAFIARGSGIQKGEMTYNVQPLCHIDARIFLAMAVVTESRYALGKRFSVRSFFREVREHQADVFCTIGTMMLLLAKLEPSAADATQPARLAFCSSTPPDLLKEFEQRFDVQVVEAYGLTEAVLVTHTHAGATQPGRVGEPIAEYDVCLLDDDDTPVAVGELGELCFRPRQAFSSMQGYWRKPAETVDAWRNLWFHTGDFLRQHPDGQFEYVGRKKDAIRRRGENISAWEVERAISAHPDVMEVAAIGVPSDLAEEDVAVLVVPRPGRHPEPADLIAFACNDLQTFAVPRYVEFVASLPKTPSERVAKSEVRARGITPAAWDREGVQAS